MKNFIELDVRCGENLKGRYYFAVDHIVSINDIKDRRGIIIGEDEYLVNDTIEEISEKMRLCRDEE